MGKSGEVGTKRRVEATLDLLQTTDLTLAQSAKSYCHSIFMLSCTECLC